MAKNLRKKLPPSDTVRVFDVNPASMEAFAKDAKDGISGGAAVEMSGSALEAVRDAVSALDPSPRSDSPRTYTLTLTLTAPSHQLPKPNPTLRILY